MQPLCQGPLVYVFNRTHHSLTKETSSKRLGYSNLVMTKTKTMIYMAYMLNNNSTIIIVTNNNNNNNIIIIIIIIQIEHSN